MITDLIHNSVQVLLSSTVLVLPTVFPLFFQVCQELEHLRNKISVVQFLMSCLVNVKKDVV